jgi:molecular chaperone GrpE
MSEKRHHSHSNPSGGSPQRPAETPEGSAASSESADRDIREFETRLAQSEARLAEAEAKAAENLDGWQRALAEFQNFKKRLDRDRENDQVAMKADLIRKVLPIVDDVERALQSRPADDAWFNGIEMIQRKLQSILEAEGVRRIEAVGAAFDPNFHEAISQEPVDGAQSGHVVAVMQNGYMLGERVIRPAQVKVAE